MGYPIMDKDGRIDWAGIAGTAAGREIGLGGLVLQITPTSRIRGLGLELRLPEVIVRACAEIT